MGSRSQGNDGDGGVLRQPRFRSGSDRPEAVGPLQSADAAQSYHRSAGRAGLNPIRRSRAAGRFIRPNSTAVARPPSPSGRVRGHCRDRTVPAILNNQPKTLRPPCEVDEDFPIAPFYRNHQRLAAMLSPPRWLVFLTLALMSCQLVGPSTRQAGAQEANETEGGQTISADVVRSRLQSIEANQTLDEAVRNRIAEIYGQVLTDLDASESLRESIQQGTIRKTKLPDRLAELNRQLESGPGESTPPDASLTQGELDKKVAELQAELTAAQSKLATLKSEPQRRAERRLEAPKQIANLVATRAELEQRKSANSARTDIPVEQREAEQLAHDVKLQNIALEIQRLTDEIAYFDAAEEVLNKEIELAEQAVARAANESKVWETAAERRRRESAAQDVAEKAIKASDVPTELQDLADGNLKLSERLRQVAEKIEEVNQQFVTTQNLLTEWGEQFTRVRALTDSQSGVSESVGNLLREQRQELPDLAKLRKASYDRRETLYEVRSEEFTTGEQLADFANLDQRVEKELTGLAPRIKPARITELQSEVTTLLEARQKTLQELQRNYKTYIDKLVTLGIQQEVLVTLINDYTSYIDERILWIRSVPPFQLSNLTSVPSALRWLASGESWRELLTGVAREVRENVLRHLALAMILIVCFAYRSRGVSQIQRLGEQAAAKGCRTFSVTVKAALWTFAVSAAGPALLMWIGWILFEVAKRDGTEFAFPFANATFLAAAAYWPLSFWMNTVRRKGLAEAHFQWSPSILKLVRWHLRWFVPSVVSLTASYALFSRLNNPAFERSLARFSLIALDLMIVVFLRFTLSPKTGAPREFLALHQNGWLDRLQYIWFPLILAVPVFVAAQAFLGYQYTAERLTIYLFWSVIYLSALYIVEAILSRWILINRRRLAIAQAKERLLTGGPAPIERERTDLQGGVTENTQVNLTQVNAQTQRLLNTFVFAAAAIGLYLIWSTALPALDRMHDVRLWRYTEALPATVATPGAPAVPSADSTTPAVAQPSARARTGPAASEGWITLGNLVGSVLLFSLTYAAVRNIPGLLEIAILQHLPLDASIRFAITTVTRYALIITGTVWAFNNIGFGWSKIQWLAAAISVGLGFGLQEIFANFVAGLILLFERPLRVGDVVTVGDVTGAVVRIRTRATTIRDWDYKELIVPNKEFITGKLLNWTLTDETNRLVFTVGVAYGSDVKRARSHSRGRHIAPARARRSHADGDIGRFRRQQPELYRAMCVGANGGPLAGRSRVARSDLRQTQGRGNHDPVPPTRCSLASRRPQPCSDDCRYHSRPGPAKITTADSRHGRQSNSRNLRCASARFTCTPWPGSRSPGPRSSWRSLPSPPTLT